MTLGKLDNTLVIYISGTTARAQKAPLGTPFDLARSKASTFRLRISVLASGAPRRPLPHGSGLLA
jgi:hypothetical protein